MPRSRPLWGARARHQRMQAAIAAASIAGSLARAEQSVQSTHEQICRGQRMTMARSIGGRPLRRASAAGTRRAGRVHEDGRDCGNPAAGPSTDRGGGARSKWPGAGHMLPRPRDWNLSSTTTPPSHLPGLARSALSRLAPRPPNTAGCWLLAAALRSALRGCNVDSCNSCLHACLVLDWTGSVARHRQGGHYRPAGGGSAGLVDCALHCTLESGDRSMDHGGRFDWTGEETRPRGAHAVVGTSPGWELAVTPEP